MSRKRLIYAWNYVEWGGAQVYTLALIKEARKHFDVAVVLPRGTDEQFLAFMRSEGVEYILFHGSIDLRPRTGIVQKIGRHVRRVRSEHAMLTAIGSAGTDDAIVHTDLLPASSLFSLVWLVLRAPVFVTVHNAMPAVSSLRWTLWKIKFGIISQFPRFRVFCANAHAARYFARLFSGDVAEELKVTYASINPDEIDKALTGPFDRQAQLARFGIDGDRFVVLTVGQFVDRKGRWTLLEAARKVGASDPRVVFLWVSPGQTEQADLDRIASFGMGENFKLIRSTDAGVERGEFLRFFRIADAFALPSYVEGLPIAMLEAMGIGIPCISTNIFGIPEALVDGETGLLIEPGDADALADAIFRLRDDAGLRARLGEAGRRIAITKFDEREAARIAVEAYMKAAA